MHSHAHSHSHSRTSSIAKSSIETIEFLKDRLYLGAFDDEPEDSKSYAYFTIDDQLIYNSFHHDFGPLHVGHLYRFAVCLHEVLGDKVNENKAVVYYSRTDSRSRANATCVLCCYMVLIQSWPPHLALAPIAQIDPPLMPFRDAGYSIADFIITVQDVVYGVWRAKEHGLADLRKFNLEDYETYERVDMGDFNLVSPYFIAFASPQHLASKFSSTKSNRLPSAFSMVLDYFEKASVGVVFRLNSRLYDKKEFERRGIKHIDMIFEDGTCPSMEMVRQFIGVCESVIAEGKKIAVHCKAGLGRTGCLIGAYLIYKFGFTASECIGYMRFIRPGMVVGPQQHWLYINQNDFRDWRHTMALNKYKPESFLSGYCALISKDQLTPNPNLCTTPRRNISNTSNNNSSNNTIIHSIPITPVRNILGEINVTTTTTTTTTKSKSTSTATPLPAPTPGQPRKTPFHKNMSNNGVPFSIKEVEDYSDSNSIHSNDDEESFDSHINSLSSQNNELSDNISDDNSYFSNTHTHSNNEHERNKLYKKNSHKEDSTLNNKSISNEKRRTRKAHLQSKRVVSARSSRRKYDEEDQENVHKGSILEMNDSKYSNENSNDENSKSSKNNFSEEILITTKLRSSSNKPTMQTRYNTRSISSPRRALSTSSSYNSTASYSSIQVESLVSQMPPSSPPASVSQNRPLVMEKVRGRGGIRKSSTVRSRRVVTDI